MATVVSTAGCPLATIKADCNKLVDILARGGFPATIVSPGLIEVLKNIAASADSTNLSTN
jgi:hypothetical protein